MQLAPFFTNTLLSNMFVSRDNLHLQATYNPGIELAPEYRGLYGKQSLEERRGQQRAERKTMIQMTKLNRMNRMNRQRQQAMTQSMARPMTQPGMATSSTGMNTGMGGMNSGMGGMNSGMGSMGMTFIETDAIEVSFIKNSVHWTSFILRHRDHYLTVFDIFL